MTSKIIVLEKEFFNCASSLFSPIYYLISINSGHNSTCWLKQKVTSGLFKGFSDLNAVLMAPKLIFEKKLMIYFVFV